MDSLKKKLCSRKLWVAIVGFIGAVGVAFGRPELTPEQATAIIAGISSLVAYIIGEGIVDSTSKNGSDK